MQMLPAASAMAEADVAASARTMSWQMLPGDSVSRLAVLFYPRDAEMQKHFISRTIALNLKQGRDIIPSRVFDEASYIIIPDLRALSYQAKSNKPKSSRAASSAMLKVSYHPESFSHDAFVSKIQAEYEALVKRNALLSEELERLNQRLANLQKSLEKLFELAKQLLAKQEAPAELHINSTPTSELVPTTASTPAPTKSEPVAAQPKAEQAKAQPPKAQQLTAEAEQAKSSPPEQSSSKLEPAPAAPDVSAALPAKKIINMAKHKAELEKPAVVEQGFLESIFSFKKRDSLFPLLLTLAATLTVVLLLASWVVAWYQNRKISLSAVPDKQLEEAVLVLPELQDGFGETPDSLIIKAGQLMREDRPERAVSLLGIYIREHPTQSVYPWLCLLEIYHELDKREEFTELVERLHTTFNVKPPTWEDLQTGAVVESSLEDFPHIVSELERVWTSDDAEHYLKELQLDNRQGERTGFSVEVLKEITILQKVLEARS